LLKRIDISGMLLWTIIFIVSAVLFALRLMTAKEPIVRLAPFKNYNFFAGSVLGMIAGVGLYGMSYLYPLYLTQVAQMSSGQIGTTLFVSGLSMLVAAPIGGLLMRLLDVRLVALIGFAMLALSTGMNTNLNADWRFNEFLLPQILRGSGLMISMVSVNTSAFGTLPANMLADASALLSLLRNLGGAIGLAAINTILLVRNNFHYARGVEYLNPGRPEVQARIDQLTAAMDGRGGDSVTMAAKQLAQLLHYQASVLSFADCFLLWPSCSSAQHLCRCFCASPIVALTRQPRTDEQSAQTRPTARPR
jgi:MFS transporter, DHA2 family, multidrug resistance protein